MINSSEELGYRLELMFDNYIDKVQNNQSIRKPHFSTIINAYRTPKKTQRELLDLFSRNKEEITCAIEGTDPQCVEAWSSILSISKLKKIEEYLSALIDVLAQNSRITRKKKKKDPVKLVKNLKFMKEDKKLDLESVDPINIIGAKCCILYNKKNNRIIFLESDEGLTVSGTTIKNFNEETSIMKAIRNNKNIFDLVTSGTPLAAKRRILTINSKEILAVGRTNDQTIILRASP
tara:strand:+ start:234 stop:935 length:702 start_codon:yes stop_codon:yes gene_type:complete